MLQKELYYNEVTSLLTSIHKNLRTLAYWQRWSGSYLIIWHCIRAIQNGAALDYIFDPCQKDSTV